MSTVLIEIPVTPIYVRDPNIGGYTIYFKEFPDVIAEGETQQEALTNLRNTIFDVYKYKNTLPE